MGGTMGKSEARKCESPDGGIGGGGGGFLSYFWPAYSATRDSTGHTVLHAKWLGEPCRAGLVVHDTTKVIP